MASTQDAPSYLDYETFLSPSFSPRSFAKALILSTNDHSDENIELQAPLSRVLFDIQEIDSHVHNLTAGSAVPLLQHTIDVSLASDRIIRALCDSLTGVTERTAALSLAVGSKSSLARELCTATKNASDTLRLAKLVMRYVQQARRLELCIRHEADAHSASTHAHHESLAAIAEAIVELADLLKSAEVNNARTGQVSSVLPCRIIQEQLVSPSETNTYNEAKSRVKSFSIPNQMSRPERSTLPANVQTAAQSELLRARTVDALSALCWLSYMSFGTPLQNQPRLVVQVIKQNVQIDVSSSVASIIRSLGSFPQLDKSLLEVTARAQNIVSLEYLLSEVRLPGEIRSRKSLKSSTSDGDGTLLELVVHGLETKSVTSYFWLRVADNLAVAMQELVHQGRQNVRILRASRERLRERIKDCVIRSDDHMDQPQHAHDQIKRRDWQREAAVMAGAMLGPLGR